MPARRMGFSVSVVLSGKILEDYSRTGDNDKDAGLYDDHVAAHELGHGRGLNAHCTETTHSGSHSADCLNQATGVVPTGHGFFCEYHAAILKDCLAMVQPTYDPTAECVPDPNP